MKNDELLRRVVRIRQIETDAQKLRQETERLSKEIQSIIAEQYGVFECHRYRIDATNAIMSEIIPRRIAIPLDAKLYIWTPKVYAINGELHVSAECAIGMNRFHLPLSKLVKLIAECKRVDEKRGVLE